MNILHYKWPALAAASLHGALFVFSPTAPLTSPATKIHEIPLGPLPPEKEPIRVVDDDMTSDPPSSTLQGGPAVPELPEDLTPPLLDNPKVMKTPVSVRTPIGPVVETLADFRGGPSGPGIGGIGGPGGLPRIQDLDRIPRATAQTSPRYPENLKKDGIAGSVTVDFFVDASGRVYHAEAIRYTHVSFVEPAISAVLKWRFEPGRRNGRPVPFRMAVPVEFEFAEK